MKKYFIAYLWVLLCSICFTACSDDTVTQSEKPIPPEPEEPIEQVMPRLYISGKYLHNEAGETVNLHGYGMTFSPYFNQNAWDNYDIAGCLS